MDDLAGRVHELLEVLCLHAGLQIGAQVQVAGHDLDVSRARSRYRGQNAPEPDSQSCETRAALTATSALVEGHHHLDHIRQ